jgi:hypothetical protein
MSETVETVVVQTENGPVVVNKSDAEKYKTEAPAPRPKTKAK